MLVGLLLNLDGAPGRGTSVFVDAVRLYDLPHRISPLARNKLSRVSRLSTTSSPKSVDEGDISVLRSAQIPRRRWSRCRTCHDGGYVVSHYPTGVDLIVSVFTPAPYPGDVSLSAEDKPPNYLIYRPPAVQLPSVPSMHHDTTPNDADDSDDADDDLLHEHHHMEDEHHNWLGGTTALKFLAAGGVAGAGQRLLRTYPP